MQFDEFRRHQGIPNTGFAGAIGLHRLDDSLYRNIAIRRVLFSPKKLR